MKKAMGYVSLLVLVLVLVAAPAFAQDGGRVGLNFSVGGGGADSLGATWHVTDHLALRPSLSYEWNRYEENGTDHTQNERHSSFGVGLGALLYLHQRESLSTYVTAAFALKRDSERVDERDISWTRDGGQASAGFGVQYAFTKRVSAFGETGLSYATGPIPVAGGRSTHFGTLRTGLGAIFYLN